ncbi:MAG: hypothetical protein IJZ53_05620 [Tyzzerella sp.]|nr:hypothetical protein [Tyzzerella sp.]
MTIYYGMIVMATVLFSLQFVFNSGYERECGNDWSVSRNFALITGIISAIFALTLNEFRFEFSWFSAGIAIVYAVVNVLYSYASIKAFSVANLSMYSMFAMLGGMLLPYLYDVITRFVKTAEVPSITGIVCCVLITVSLLLTVEKGTARKGAIKYYLLVFCLNGLVGVLSTIHQSNNMAVSSNAFLFLNRMATVMICLGFILIDKNKSLKLTLKAVGYSAGYSIFCTTGNLLLLVALAAGVPAAVQYPIVTGGVIVLSAIVDVIRKEKVTPKTWIGVGIAFIASVVIAL